MKERVKVFTYSLGTGATVIESKLEDRINDFLAQTKGTFVRATQSESERQGTAHVTVCVWYEPVSS
jgi:hypothetical protein